MAKIKIQTFVQADQEWSGGVLFVLSLFKPVLGIEFEILSSPISGCFIISSGIESSIKVNKNYWHHFISKEYQECHSLFCQMDDIYFLEKIFHLVNCVQEYDSNETDAYGRFSYYHSWQYINHNITHNVVLETMETFIRSYFRGTPIVKPPTRLFLSHDIDTIHGELMQNGRYYLKTFQFDKLKKVVLNYLLNRPGWANMDLINRLHDDYGVKHAYFWLVEKGKQNNIINADYSKSELSQYSQQCTSNGLHKSSGNADFRTETELLPFPCIANRNHFLRYRLPSHWEELEDAELKVDASVGFAEHFGFRNSYGYAFRPYNPNKQKCYSHIAVPLHMMDATFRNYMKLPVEETGDTVIDFIEANKTGCILSLLWHNTFFTNGKYEGYAEQYIKILRYLHDNQFETLDINDLTQIEVN